MVDLVLSINVIGLGDTVKICELFTLLKVTPELAKLVGVNVKEYVAALSVDVNAVLKLILPVKPFIPDGEKVLAPAVKYCLVIGRFRDAKPVVSIVVALVE